MNKKKKQGFCSYIKDKYNGYKKLPKRIRSIVALWCVVVLVLVIIIVICNINNSYIEKYTKAEEQLAKSAVKYAEDNELAGIDSQKLRLDMTVLIKSKYLKVDEDVEKKCVGYALVFTNRDDEVRSNAYLSCEGYTTKGFALE